MLKKTQNTSIFWWFGKVLEFGCLSPSPAEHRINAAECVQLELNYVSFTRSMEACVGDAKTNLAEELWIVSFVANASVQIQKHCVYVFQC